MHNHGRLTELAELLESADEGENFVAYLPIGGSNLQRMELGFDMDMWFKQEDERGKVILGDYYKPVPLHDCDTVCCLGGTANLIWGKSRTREEIDDDQRAKKILGLDYEEGDKLFYPKNYWSVFQEHLVAANAAKVIRHLIATGEVDWGITGAERREDN